MKIDLDLPPTPEDKPERESRGAPEDPTLGLGAVIKKIRVARGLSQAELGRRAGLGGQTIAAIEAGKQRLAVYQLKWLADELDMELTIGLAPAPAPSAAPGPHFAGLGERAPHPPGDEPPFAG